MSHKNCRVSALAGALSLVLLILCTAGAQAAGPIGLTLDTSKAPSQNVVFTKEHIPANPGTLTLYYPNWIPGQHQAVGPIANFAQIAITANGKTIPWHRQPKDMFAFEVSVPAGATAIDVSATYLGATFGNYSSSRLATPNMLVITWDQNLLYPSTGTIQDTIFSPTIILPATDWGFATALTGAKRTGNSVAFDDVSLEHLIDSPLDAGVNYKRWKLWEEGDASAYLNVFGDTPEEVDASPATVDKYKKLVREMIAMYGGHHWRNYNFLLTVSDEMPGEGIEHHESSDDGDAGDYLIDPMTLAAGGDLLSHEFNHSWDGKYRMPVGLYPSNLQLPYDDSLLWVYEGMTQYYGNVMSYRDGIRKGKDYPDTIAALYARYDNMPGRLWSSLGADATAAPFIYSAPRGYGSERRGEDFYSEAELMWLKADSIIRERSGGAKSLDTFARTFFGKTTTGPIVETYDRGDVIAGLNAVMPYDWAGFFHTWVDAIAVHPPDGFTADGWKFVYTAEPSHEVKANNFFYSLGFSMRGGSVGDVRFGSPAWSASLGINTKIVAVNGREYSDEALNNALKEAQKTHAPIQLLVTRGELYRTISIPYFGGPRYPHLVRIDGKPDRLGDVVKSLTP
ncbi:MAG: hypothetical protein M3R30_00765 [Candidatus Eremiobacteraeota bacterium]|nr:hypothetical protein [Candidatus Eremiobacteraeota bacterium]